uniref:Uncharacterized protein n=1 Tax=Aegilops tauschii subsp. strangulata TaxID=200361 RepID=A0A453DK50_AEGTS
MQYPAGVILEDTLRMWAISRWRCSTELANFFLVVGYCHLPGSSPVMLCVEEVRGNGGLVIGLTARFTNHFDAYFLLGKVFWCGCEFIAFTNFGHIFPTANGMHTLPYNTEDEE